MTYGHPNIQRPGPRIDERRDDPQERQAIRAGIAVGFVLGLLMVIAAVAYVARAV